MQWRRGSFARVARIVKASTKTASTETSTVRLDKWLFVARVFKTRALAKRACDLGRVRVDGSPAKPHRGLGLGARVEAQIGDWRRVLVVRALRDKPVKKSEVENLFEDLSLPRPRPTKLERLMRRPAVIRARGEGRPSKKQRRELDRLRDDAAGKTLD